MIEDFNSELYALHKSTTPFVCVTLVEVVGSVPQNAGAKMLVTSQGLHAGTIGGGALEGFAIQEAQRYLDQGIKTKFVDLNLKKDLGMVCGGTCKLFYEIFNTHIWNVVVFGAGHVASVMVPLMLNLSCRVTCVDTREEWLEKLPTHARLKKICVEDMSLYIKEIPMNAFVVIMTRGHEYDFSILKEVLKENKFPYVGLMGSKTKVGVFRSDLKKEGFSQEQVDSFYSPIGLPLGTNHLYEISISIIAQLIQKRDELKS